MEMVLHRSGEGSDSPNQLTSLSAAVQVLQGQILHPTAWNQTMSPGEQGIHPGTRNSAVPQLMPQGSHSTRRVCREKLLHLELNHSCKEGILGVGERSSSCYALASRN